MFWLDKLIFDGILGFFFFFGFKTCQPIIIGNFLRMYSIRLTMLGPVWPISEDVRLLVGRAFILFYVKS